VTNRLYDSNVRGIAYIGTVCNGTLSYSVSSMKPNDMYGPPTFPHELGHNFGAEHDTSSGNIMFAAVYENTLYNGFSQKSIDEMNAELATLGTFYFQPNCIEDY